MNAKSNVLILSASFGNGHKSAANALKAQIEKDNQNYNIEIIDLLLNLDPLVNTFFSKLYNYVTNKMVPVYNWNYEIKNTKSKGFTDKVTFEFYKSDLTTLIDKHNPSVIISTFPFYSGLIARYIKKSGKNIKLITCITDVVDSWEWLHQGTDLYFAPTETIKDKLIIKGIHPDSILVTGVPVKDDFINKKRPIPSNGYTKKLLIVEGTMESLSINDDFLQEIDQLKNTETTVLTGRNEKLFKKLSKHNYNNIKIQGYTTEMSKYMNEADLIVTKAGGATLFESIHTQTPLIVKSSKVGQEKSNVDFIKEQKIGIVIDSNSSMLQTIKSTLNDDDRIKNMTTSINELVTSLNYESIPEYVQNIIEVG